MNLKKAKMLRFVAKGVSKMNEFPFATIYERLNKRSRTITVHPQCFRGVYHDLKKNF